MLVSVFCDPAGETVQLTIALPPDGPRWPARICRVLRPGDAYGRYTYEMLRAMGTGRHELYFTDAKGSPAR
jgi:hypothetical protein